MDLRDLKYNVFNNAEGFTREQTDEIVDLFLDVLVASIETGERVTIRNVGSFYLNERKGYYTTSVKDPNEQMYIKPTTTVKFTPSKYLKEIVNESKEEDE